MPVSPARSLFRECSLELPSSSTCSLSNASSKLMEIRYEALPPPSFSIFPLFKMYANALWSYPPLPVHAPYYILIQNDENAHRGRHPLLVHIRHQILIRNF